MGTYLLLLAFFLSALSFIFACLLLTTALSIQSFTKGLPKLSSPVGKKVNTCMQWAPLNGHPSIVDILNTYENPTPFLPLLKQLLNSRQTTPI